MAMHADARALHARLWEGRDGQAFGGWFDRLGVALEASERVQTRKLFFTKIPPRFTS